MTALKAQVAPPTGTACADDFHTWTQEQGAHLRAGDLSGLDLENLAEEIESLGRSEAASLVGALRIVRLHMREFDHQPARRTRSWAIPIATHRDGASDALRDSPGLKSGSDEAVERAYRKARLEASEETRLPLRRFPEPCPYHHRDIVDRPFRIASDA